MAVSNDFRLLIEGQLAAVGPLQIKAMFEGAGIYAQDVMFALVSRETLYLKTDAETLPAFLEAGSTPFTFIAKRAGQPVHTCYWSVPEWLFDDIELMKSWALGAIAAAKRARA
jgi:DNA transformation protein